jgi:hypothetical protein
MKLMTSFISQHKEAEPLNTKPCPSSLMDEYVANDNERANNPICKFHDQLYVVRLSFNFFSPEQRSLRQCRDVSDV